MFEDVHAAPTSIGSAVRQAHAARGRARRFWQVFDKSVVPMATVDNQRRYLAANAANRLLFRLRLDEMLVRRIDDLTPPHMRDTLNYKWERLMREGAVSGPYDASFSDGSQLKIVYCALANVLPGQHLIVCVPAEWPQDELLAFDEQVQSESPGRLSPREREVLSLIAGGANLPQIADELTLAVSTVRTHTRNALRKLGARNRAHAIALAMQHGLIDLAPPSSDDPSAA